MSQPAARAGEALAAEVFCRPSRYHRSDGGDVASLEAISRRGHPDVPGSATRPFRRRLSSSWATSRTSTSRRSATPSSTAGPTATSPPPAAGRLAPAARAPGRRGRPPGLGAVDALVGHDGPPRKIDDYVAMTTMSLVLGGMFSSRLNLKIREEKGYAYGAHSGFDTRKYGGMFAARAAVQSDVTIPALADMVAEIERMHTGGVEPEELEQARAYRAGVFPINFAGVSAVAAGLGDLVVNDFADDHFDQLRARVLGCPQGRARRECGQPAPARRPRHRMVGDATGFADRARDRGSWPGRGHPRRGLSHSRRAAELAGRRRDRCRRCRQSCRTPHGGGQRRQAAPATAQTRVVVIAVPDLRWSDLASMPQLAAYAETASVGDLSVRGEPDASRCADGSLTFAAGNRADAGGATGCALTPAQLSTLRPKLAHDRYGSDISALGDALQQAGVSTAAVGPGAQSAARRRRRASVPHGTRPAGGAWSRRSCCRPRRRALRRAG